MLRHWQCILIKCFKKILKAIPKPDHIAFVICRLYSIIINKSAAQMKCHLVYNILILPNNISIGVFG